VELYQRVDFARALNQEFSAEEFEPEGAGGRGDQCSVFVDHQTEEDQMMTAKTGFDAKRAAKKRDVFKPVKSPPSTVRTARSEEAPSSRRPDREGKKALHVHLPASIHKQLRRLAVERETDATVLVVEALTDLFAKHR
jgi:hypothetical protein